MQLIVDLNGMKTQEEMLKGCACSFVCVAFDLRSVLSANCLSRADCSKLELTLFFFFFQGFVFVTYRAKVTHRHCTSVPDAVVLEKDA